MSIGNIKDYTPNFKFIIPSFDIATWHDYIEENFRNIDALFYNLFGINNYSGTWKNITSYTAGQVLFVGEDKDLEGNDTDYVGRLVKVLVDHTTDNSDYFNIYYNLHPEYYELFADASTAQYYAQIAQNNANSTTNLRQETENLFNFTKDLRNETQNLRNDTLTFRNNAEDFSTNAKTSADNAQVSAENAQDYLNLTQETYYNAVNEVNSTKSEAIIQIDQNADQKITEFDNLATQNTQTATNLLNQTQIAAQNAQNYAQEAWGKISNVGDIFYSLRLDDELNGAVVCNGNYYELEDFTGTHSIKNLLEQNKLTYVSLDEYENTLNTYGSVRCFGYDIGGTQFRVPTLDDVYIKAGIANLPNEFNVESLPNHTHRENFVFSEGVRPLSSVFNASDGEGNIKSLTQNITHKSSATTSVVQTSAASDSNSVYKNGAKVNPDNIRYRAFVQLANSATENAVISATSAISKLSDASYKSKDETITGQWTFETTNERTFDLIANDIDSSVTPSNNVTQGIIAFKDMLGEIIGYLFAHKLANGSIQIGFQAKDSSDHYSTMAVGVDSSGTSYMQGVTPPNSANNTLLATTAFVKNILKTSGVGLATISKGANGYCKFTNGLIIQWGKVSSASSSTAVTLPTAFSGTNYSVTITSIGNSGVYQRLISADTAKTSTKFTTYASGGASSDAFHWLAIGY